MACRQIRDKKVMLRIVRTPGGKVEIDGTGKKDGRGAYLCSNRECFKKALKGKQLENTLRCSLPEEIRDQLLKFGEDLPGGID